MSGEALYQNFLQQGGDLKLIVIANRFIFFFNNVRTIPFKLKPFV